jgi:MFS transporter, UMF1 family
MFGLFSLSGKVTAFAGPALVGWIALMTDSYRLGMAVVPVFLVAGLWLLSSVKELGKELGSDSI